MPLPNRHNLDRFDFNVGLEIANSNPPFYSLIVAAMLRADTQNYILLAGLWPNIAADAQNYYNGTAVHDENGV